MGGVCTDNGGALIILSSQFWFCRNPGLALPLIALQYQKLKLFLNHSFGTGFWNAAASNKLFCDYIYLDTDETKRLHKYLRISY